ncbi:MAG: hypothetical protein WEC59_05070 [Salibacteraceae bacterium]
MKSFALFLFISLLPVVTNCQSLSDDLVSRWEVQSITEGKRVVESKETGHQATLELHSDQMLYSQHSDLIPSEAAWSIDESSQALMVSKEHKTITWKVEMNGDEMKWKNSATKPKRQITIVFERANSAP